MNNAVRARQRILAVVPHHSRALDRRRGGEPQGHRSAHHNYGHRVKVLPVAPKHSAQLYISVRSLS